MRLENFICTTTCKYDQVKNHIECIKCKLNCMLQSEISINPMFNCFSSNRIYLEMDNKSNSIVVGFYDDPKLLIAAITQTDSYQIACEEFNEFKVIIESIQHDSINCEITPKITKEGKSS